MKKTTLAVSIALGLMSSSAFAMHQAGDMFVRTGPIMVVPNTSTNNSALPLEVNANTQLGLTGTYMITDNLGVELLAATPFTHKIKLKGDTIATTKQLPPTLYLQWYFLDKDSKARPYVGAGLNYTKFFGTKEKIAPLTDLKLKQSWGPAVNAGVDIKLTDRVFFNTSMWYAKIKSKATFKLAGTYTEVDVKLDPMVFMMGVGYKF